MNAKKPKPPVGAGRFSVEALKLTELAKREGIGHRVAQSAKDLYVAVVIPYGRPRPDGTRKERVRFLDSGTSAAILRHNGIEPQEKPKTRKPRKPRP